MKNIRIAIAIPGIALGLFGVFRLLTEVPASSLVELGIWLAAAVILHDGVLSPVLVGLGWVIARVVPPRARAWVQGGLIAAALVTVIALPMIYVGDVQPASKAILRQNYTANLVLTLTLVAAVTLVAYAVSLARARARRVSTAKRRSAEDHVSTSE